MSIRDERAAAITRRYRDLSDNFTRALPGLLDELENIDEAQPVTVVVAGSSTVPDDAAIAAWIERNPKAMEAWVRKRNRINGGSVRGVPGDAPGSVPPLTSMPLTVQETPQASPTEQAATPAKPTTRRRTTR